MQYCIIKYEPDGIVKCVKDYVDNFVLLKDRVPLLAHMGLQEDEIRSCVDTLLISVAPTSSILKKLRKEHGMGGLGHLVLKNN